jgi:RNA polymerase sigma factor (sigma-70 family)
MGWWLVTGTAARMQPSKSADERLVAECVKGDERAWSALIDKYKNLIYSIPIKLGMYEDAPDIFQTVCLDLLSELPRLRKPRALPKWLMQNCYHKCLRQRRSADRRVDLADEHLESRDADSELPEEILAQLEREQKLREVIAKLPERCRRMIQMLFFETPARPYQEIAHELGLATGSIGFIRGRCLTRLRKELERVGF